jgi:hypothetical protein
MQRIALYAALGYLLSALGASISDPLFWCAIALFIMNEFITKFEVEQQWNSIVEEYKSTLTAAVEALEEAQKQINAIQLQVKSNEQHSQEQ